MQPRYDHYRSKSTVGITQITVRRIIRMGLRVKPYRLQLLQALNHDDKTRFRFYAEMDHHLRPV